MSSPRRASGIDGIRALAVAAVVVYHLNPEWLPAGFIGVDVFFVISGYLITNLLVEERARFGKFRLRRFWVRRARRLLPALLGMLLVVSAAIGLLGDEAHARLRASVVAAVTYTSNWWQIHTHEAYFSELGIPAPLKHLWSLSVEEQFYLVWPFALALILRVPGRRTRTRICGCFAGGSALLMGLMYVPGSDPSRVYYGTDTHATGLLVGATLAMALPLARLQARRQRVAVPADVLGALSLALLVVVACLCSGQDRVMYQGGAAAVCVAAAGLLIAAAVPGLTCMFLSLGPFAWLGIRSYGIYLWHWPVITFATVIAGGRLRSITDVALAVAVTLVLAAASWRWLEEPIRRDGFFATLRHWSTELRALVSPCETAGRRFAGVVLSIGLVATSSCAAIGLARPPADKGVAQQIAEGQEAAAESEETAPPEPEPTAGSRGGTVLPGQEPLVVPSPGKEPLAVPSAGSRCLDRPSGADLTAIGDSVMLAAASRLRAKLPGIVIDAKVGRQMADAPSAIRRLRANGRLRQTVLIGLGTNGAFSGDVIARALDTLGSDRRALLINVYAPRSWEEPVNRALQHAARAGDNVRLVDWHAAIQGAPRTLWTDRVHPRPGAAGRYANLMAKAICQGR